MGGGYVKTCPYCETKITVKETGVYINHGFCEFCHVLLGPNSHYGMYNENGLRGTKKRMKMVVLEEAKKSLPELLTLHTVDLLFLLRLARVERAAQYNLLRIYNKAGDEGIDLKEYQETFKHQGGEYEYWTRNCWRIENIIYDRLGYFPEKITDEFILRYEARVEKLPKSMKISKERIKKKPVHN